MKWISVKDSYPEKYVEVLVYNGFEIRMSYFRDDEWIDSYSNDFDVLKEITHWMPLPEVPEVQ